METRMGAPAITIKVSKKIEQSAILDRKGFMMISPPPILMVQCRASVGFFYGHFIDTDRQRKQELESGSGPVGSTSGRFVRCTGITRQ